MSDEDAEERQGDDSAIEAIKNWARATHQVFRLLPSAKRTLDKLTGGLISVGTGSLESRLRLYQTSNLVKEAELIASTSGLPLPMVFNALLRQRRIDELTIEAVRRVAEKQDARDQADSDATGTANSTRTTNRWLETLYQEAGTVDEDDIREAFIRVLANEIESPGAFSVRTLRILGAMSQSTARRFRRAASVCIRLKPDGMHVMDARIPALGGVLGHNCLKNDGLSYSVLTDLTENGLVHSEYNTSHPYGPLELLDNVGEQVASVPQIPFGHQDAKWMLIPVDINKKPKPIGVVGAQLTSCGIELLRIVDIEPLPDFTNRLIEHFLQSGYRMVRTQA